MNRKHQFGRATQRACVGSVSLLLVTTLALFGCGESGKERAVKRGEAAAGEQHRERLITGQTDR